MSTLRESRKAVGKEDVGLSKVANLSLTEMISFLDTTIVSKYFPAVTLPVTERGIFAVKIYEVNSNIQLEFEMKNTANTLNTSGILNISMRGSGVSITANLANTTFPFSVAVYDGLDGFRYLFFTSNTAGTLQLHGMNGTNYEFGDYFSSQLASSGYSTGSQVVTGSGNGSLGTVISHVGLSNERVINQESNLNSFSVSNTLVTHEARSYSGAWSVTDSIAKFSKIRNELGQFNTPASAYSFLSTVGAAVQVRTGSLLASNSYSDSSKVPVNGIYSKGDISGGDRIYTTANLNESAAIAHFNNTSTSTYSYGLRVDTGKSSGSNYALYVATAGIGRMRVRNDGVIDGNARFAFYSDFSSSSYMMDLRNTGASGYGVYIQTGAVNGAPALLVRSNGGSNTIIRADNDGKVGINNNTAVYELDVTGTVRASTQLIVGSGGARPWITIDSPSTGDNATSQGAGISIGENGKFGSAAVHLTYTGDGYSHLGMGTVGSTGYSAYRVMRMHYQSNLALFYGDIQLVDSNTKLKRGTGNSLRVQTNHGYMEIGPQNTTWAHMITDRTAFYTNKYITSNGGYRVYNGGANNQVITNGAQFVGFGGVSTAGKINTSDRYSIDGSEVISTTKVFVGSGGVNTSGAVNSSNSLKILGNTVINSSRSFIGTSVNTSGTITSQGKSMNKAFATIGRSRNPDTTVSYHTGSETNSAKIYSTTVTHLQLNDGAKHFNKLIDIRASFGFRDNSNNDDFTLLLQTSTNGSSWTTRKTILAGSNTTSKFLTTYTSVSYPASQATLYVRIYANTTAPNNQAHWSAECDFMITCAGVTNFS